MAINYERRITVNFPSVEDAHEIKQQAKAHYMSPSQWIIFQLKELRDIKRIINS